MKTYRIARSARLISSLVVVCALVPVKHVRAQGVGTRASTAWTSATGYLGIENFQCDCTVDVGGDGKQRRFVFRSEPVLLGVMPGSPASGLLERGDMITHVDGHSILSAEGARRLARIEPGDDVNLTIRRAGRAMKVSLRASGSPHGFAVVAPEGSGSYVYTWDVPATSARASTSPVAAVAPVPGAKPATPAPGVWVGYGVDAVTPAMPATPAPAVPGAPGAVWVVPAVPATPATPSGWFGFSIRCNDCGWSSNGRPGAAPVWESNEPPELSMVAADGPAGRAGLRAGDRITHIDGFAILSPQGARRFGSVEPGQRVRLTFRRGRQYLTRTVTLGTRPEVRAAIAAGAPRPARTPTPPAARRELRYSGQLDNVSVEVWSPGGPSVEKIGDTMVITVGASVVRLKVDSKKEKF